MLNGFFNFNRSMKDRAEFKKISYEAIDDILTYVKEQGGSASKSKLDDRNYKFYEEKFGVKETKASYFVWVAVSEDLYKELEWEKLLELGKNTVWLTDEGKKAAKLGYSKYRMRKELDRIFGEVKKAADGIKDMAFTAKILIVVGILTVSVILYIVNMLLQ